MNRHARILSLLLCITGVLMGTVAVAKTGIVNTKHNLSITGLGDIKATSEVRICVFCHTPHNSNPQTPLWNKGFSSVTYDPLTLYSSSTMVAGRAQPTGSSRLCLSCHDGTIALGQVLLPQVPITMNIGNSGIPSGRPSNFGATLANHHPISFSYFDSLPNSELNPLPPTAELLLYNNSIIQCDTCHDPHDNTNKKFLAVSNENSGLCMLCHVKDGWPSASHNTSPATWNGSPPIPWPRTFAAGPWDFGWTTVKQNGCENCHAPHSAIGAQRLLNSALEEQNCFPCHNGNATLNVPAKNIQSQFGNLSKHDVARYTGVHDPKAEQLSPRVVTRHVECVDCHNPHASNSSTAVAPFVSGKTAKVSGVNKDGVSIMRPDFTAYEYEICFKCHADSTPLPPFITRVINTTNARFQFNAMNPSYHPVTDIGKISLLDVPSLNPPTQPVMDPEVPMDLNVASYIYCTDCHSDEIVVGSVLMSRGPHGSPYPPILRRQYLTTMGGGPESRASYGLCYRCHERDNGIRGILNDASFKKNSVGYGGHSGHLNSTGPLATAVNAPCSVCHDPHGVQDNSFGAGPTGSHTHLVNFDTAYVTTAGGPGTYPFYTDKGGHSGSCTLICHGVKHDGSVKYFYGGSGGVQIRWKN
jgi:predicted CXXCH cytochrome family protein